ncbi:MAG: hypothetical protein V4459_07445 [Pseudomonadota bacterium]
MPRQLLHDHARIIAAVEANMRMVSGPRPENFDAMAGNRWAFTREFLLHCARVEAQVLRPLSMDRRPHVAAAAKRSRTDLESLVAAFKAHVQRWAGLAGEAEWPTYVRATSTLMARMRDRLIDEQRDIFDHLPAQSTAAGAPPAANYAQEAWAIRGAIFTGRVAS